MTDYTELIANLREEAEAIKAIEWDIPICTENHILKAADAIEELIEKFCKKVSEITKERDAAIEDLRVCSFRADRECVYCKSCGRDKMCDKCGMKSQNWRWRGCVDGDNC